MKKIFVILSLVAFSLTVGSLALAESNNDNSNNDEKTWSNSTSTEKRNDNSSSSVKAKATSTETRDNNRASSTEDSPFNTEDHRSVVASFVQSLLIVADREGGIGDQVREIARSQHNSASTSNSAIDKIEGKSDFRTFFFGSDYHNLGVLQRELATTTENINRLQLLLSQTTNTVDRVELSNQIQILEEEKVKIENFVHLYENKFSLFGWFNRFFTE